MKLFSRRTFRLLAPLLAGGALIAGVACGTDTEIVVQTGADEHETPRRDHRTARTGETVKALGPRYRPKRHLPDNLPAREVDRSDRSPRWWRAWQTARRPERLTTHPERRAPLGCVFVSATCSASCLEFVPRNQLDVRRAMMHLVNHDPAFAIPRTPTPVNPTAVSRHENRSPHVGRCKGAFPPGTTDDRAAFGKGLVRDAKNVIRLKWQGVDEWVRKHGYRLRRRHLIA